LRYAKAVNPLINKRNISSKFFSIELLFVILVLFLPLTPIATVYAQPKLHFVVYGTIACSDCRSELEMITELFGNESLFFYELSSREGAKFILIVEQIYELAFPQGIRATPLIIVFSENRPIAILAGYHGREFLLSLEQKTDNGSVMISYKEQKLRYLGYDEMEKLEEILTSEPSIIQFELGKFSILAAVDSVNPCTFIVFTSILILSMAHGGRGTAIKSGIVFVMAVYICYLLIGLGLFAIAPYLRALTPVLSAILIAVGIFELRNFKSGVHRAPLPNILRKITIRRFELFERSSSLIGALFLGILVSFTLLPCSMGPYLVASSLLVGMNKTEAFLALILYNTIFILPLIGLIVGVWVGLRSKTMKRWIGTRATFLDMISGFLLLSLGLYFLTTSHNTPAHIRAFLGISAAIIPFLDTEKFRSFDKTRLLIFSIGLISSITLLVTDPLKALLCGLLVLSSAAVWVKGKRHSAIFLFALTCMSILWFSLSIPRWNAQVIVRWPNGAFLEFPQYSCGCHRAELSNFRVIGRPSIIEIWLKQRDRAKRTGVRWILSINDIEVSSGELVSSSHHAISNISVESLEEVMRLNGMIEGRLSLRIWLYLYGEWQYKSYESIAIVKIGDDGLINEISWEGILNEDLVRLNFSGWLALVALVFSIITMIEHGVQRFDKGRYSKNL